MKKILLLLLPVLLFSQDYSLAEKYEKQQRFNEAGDLYLKMISDKDNIASRKLGLMFIYKMNYTKENCRKGVIYLLKATSDKEGTVSDPFAYKEISTLFKNGICLNKNNTLSKKYLSLYEEKIKN
jgi:hypothetical protein